MPQQHQKTVTISNGQSTKTSKTTKIKIDSLPEEAKIGNILPGIKNNLIAAPLLGDADCELLFRKKYVLVTKDKILLLKGWRDPINQVWRVPQIQDKKIHHQNIIMKFYPRTTITIKNNDNDEFIFSPSYGYKNQNLQTAHIFAKLKKNW